MSMAQKKKKKSLTSYLTLNNVNYLIKLNMSFCAYLKCRSCLNKNDTYSNSG